MAEAEVKSEVAADTSSEATTEKKLSADAFQNFIQGKRHMLVQDYSNAVASLADACELYVEHFGQMAPECGEVYFHYGKALFRLFQQQAGIIGNLVSDESSNEEAENSDSEDDKEKENTDDTSNENENEENDEQENEEEENDEEDLGDDDTSKEGTDSGMKADSPQSTDKLENDAGKIEGEGVGSSAQKDDETVVQSDATKENEEPCDPALEQPGPSSSRPKTEEEISDLQLAWETLETAKSIFRKQGDNSRESQLKVSEILLILAEISMELENNVAARDDLLECLDIREQHLERDDRLIAETYYQMGLLYTFDSQIDLALESYQRSMDCISLRISNLKKQTVIQKTPEGFDINPADEILELEAILPDIKGKMEDTQESVQDTKNLVKQLVYQNVDEVNKSGNTSDKPVTNINHLLKRKKPDDQDVANPVEAKKIKLTSVPSGDEQVKPDSTSSSDGMSNA